MRAQDGVRRELRELVAQLAGVELLDRAFQLAEQCVARRPVALRI
jgi:hypothetical protein